MTLRLLAAALFAAAVAGSPAAAQVTATATADIPQVLTFNVTGTDVTFTGIAKADFDAGNKQSSVVSTITHAGNVAHAIQVASAASNPSFMTATTGGRTDKPIADLRYKTTTFSSSTDLGTGMAATVATLGSFAAGNYDGTSAMSVNYKLVLSYLDKTATYTLPFTYTVIAQ